MPSHIQSHFFLVFAGLLVLSDALFDTMVSFAAFDITGSYQILSIIPSLSSMAYIAFGLFAGVIIDALSKRLFILVHTVSFFPDHAGHVCRPETVSYTHLTLPTKA